MNKQVNEAHYSFSQYIDKQRWSSLWHQVDEIIKLDPGRILEIGPGPGLFKAVATALGLQVETLDIDPDLKPDHLHPVANMPFKDGEYDIVCAFQVLEHMPFEQSLAALTEMSRVARTAVVLSLPDAKRRWPVSFFVPAFGIVYFSIPRPRLRAPVHHFDGQHYWELNKAGYELSDLKSTLETAAAKTMTRTFRVPDFPYHRFMIFTSPEQSN